MKFNRYYWGVYSCIFIIYLSYIHSYIGCLIIIGHILYLFFKSVVICRQLKYFLFSQASDFIFFSFSFFFFFCILCVLYNGKDFNRNCISSGNKISIIAA